MESYKTLQSKATENAYLRHKISMLRVVQGELPKPSIDFLGVLILAEVFFLQRPILGKVRRVGRAFLIGHRRWITSQTPQSLALAIGQVGRHLDPLPDLQDQRLGFGLKLLGVQQVEQRRVLEPATIVTLEEIAQYDIARRLIAIYTDKHR
jgi:hypothetical protein